MTKKHKYLICIFFVFLFSIPAIAGLLHRGFFSSDDGNWMIIRFSAFYEALRNGQFPVRFLPRLNHGYGYPVGDFLYPLFMYLGVPIHIIGFNFTNTIKIIFGGSIIFSGIFCFLWLKKLFSFIPSLVGAVIYVLFPYHIFDMYQRGSIGEVLALTVVPCILWQIERKSVLFASIGIACLILAHNTLALLFLPVILLYAWVRKALPVRYMFLCFFYGLALSAFFWIPALYDKQYTIFDSTVVADSAKYFITQQNIGLFGLISAFIGAASLFFLKGKKNTTFTFFFVIALLSSFFSLSASSTFWHILPLSKFIQFPFRFLSVVMICLAYLSAYILQRQKNRMVFFTAVVCLALLYISSWQFMIPKNFQDYPDAFYSTNEDTTTVQNEYMPAWVKRIPSVHPAEKARITVGLGEIDNIVDRPNKIVLTANVKSNSLLQVNTVYFPGWQAFIDEKPVQIFYQNPYGLITIPIPAGVHVVRVIFGETPLRLFSDVIAIVGCIELAIWFFRSKCSIMD